MTIGSRIILEGRKPLETLLPLEAPLVLFVDPCDDCCLSCSFCPTGSPEILKETTRPLRSMNLDLFKKIIDDLNEFKTNIKVLRLYSHGEPLMNPNFSDMVKYAKQSGKIDMVDTTTNGIVFNPKRNLEIIESGIDRINISINGLSDEQYFKFTGTKVKFKKLVEDIKHLYDNRKQCYIFIKINGDTISKEDEEKFLEIFEPIADSVAIEKSMSCWDSFEPKGFVKTDDNIGIYGQTLEKEVDVCPYIFYQMAIQSDGLVSLCFLDWSRKMSINSVITNSVYDIWNSNILKAIQITMLKGKRSSIPICSKCNQLVKGMPSDIDDFKDELLEKYKGDTYE